ncbi:MAG: hypothetical protein COA50_11580 [Flavobacteriaceae bacterium]|nr:MAG: hypothetical protein COA50_11580 [Flavobacteriaceae bacterium]
MKKNKKTYVLLSVVLAIWGILGYKIIVGIGSDDVQRNEMALVETYVPIKVKKRDTFVILANYRDPFLGTMPKKAEVKNKRNVVPKKTVLPKKDITYSGSVSQSNTNNRMFFISIDGQQYIMSKKEEIVGVRLVSGNEQQIKVRYNGRTETISLTE